MTIYSLGHSNRSLEDFILLLKDSGIKTLVDVRSYPGSKYVPHFNKEVLEESLRDEGIGYHHLRKLGGRRRPLDDIDQALVSAWKKEAFRNYAVYSLTEDYKKGLEELMLIAGASTTAIMCAEALPWRCHRLIISNSLLALGHEVIHITGRGQFTKHELGLYGPEPKMSSRGLIYPEKGG